MKNRVYVAHPVDTTYQAMNIYVPRVISKEVHQRIYGQDGAYFLPTVGGYMPGNRDNRLSKIDGGANAILVALFGYVVAAPGAAADEFMD